MNRYLIRFIGVMTGILLFAGITFTLASEFSVNTHRFDPYKQFKFRIKWDGRYIPGITRVSGLHRTTTVVKYRDGKEKGSSRKIPGNTEFLPLVLERGRTHDTAFEQWADQIWKYDAGSRNTNSQNDYLKNIRIELYNEADQLVMAFTVYGCWPSKYSPLMELEANTNEVAVEALELQYQGWERDYSVYEPSEPSF